MIRRLFTRLRDTLEQLAVEPPPKIRRRPRLGDEVICDDGARGVVARIDGDPLSQRLSVLVDLQRSEHGVTRMRIAMWPDHLHVIERDS